MPGIKRQKIELCDANIGIPATLTWIGHWIPLTNNI